MRNVEREPQRLGPVQAWPYVLFLLLALVLLWRFWPGMSLRYSNQDVNSGPRAIAPRESFSSALRKTVRWYLGNLPWCERVREGKYQGERLGSGR